MIESDWKDYEIIATGGGEKLERWGDIILIRPDPQIIWPAAFDLSRYKNIAAVYKRSDKGGGGWVNLKRIPDEWTVSYKNLRFSLKLMGFKHVGLFPEQAVNWQLMTQLIKNRLSNNPTNNQIDSQKKDLHKKPSTKYPSGNISDLENTIDLQKDNPPDISESLLNNNYAGTSENGLTNISEKNQDGKDGQNGQVSVLNLFAYTGGASVACAKAGAKVTHVDAAKGMVDRAKQNALLSDVGEGGIRYIIDDCIKFVNREIRRGSLYDAVIMDPPSYGRGPSGEIWKIEDNLFELVKLCVRVLKPDPLFMLINSYTTGLQPTVIENILQLCLKDFKGGAKGYEVCLPTNEGIPLPCGCSGLWTANRFRTEL